MDPASSGDLQKLREAIRHSQNELEPFRQQYRERLVQYAGDGYGDNRDAVDSPFNVYNLALRIYKRRLFSGQMRVLVTSRSPSERRAAWELGLAACLYPQIGTAAKRRQHVVHGVSRGLSASYISQSREAATATSALLPPLRGSAPSVPS